MRKNFPRSVVPYPRNPSGSFPAVSVALSARNEQFQNMKTPSPKRSIIAVLFAAMLLLGSIAGLKAQEFGVFYDFNTPGSFSNMYYNVQFNDWVHNLIPPQWFEVRTGGVGNSGAVDMIVGSGDATIYATPVTYDFTQDGKTLTMSTMVKLKAPTANNRMTQIGFAAPGMAYSGTAPGLTAIGINDTTPQGFMTVILQSTAQPALTYELRFQHRRTDGSIATVDAPTGRTPATAPTLVLGNWYRLTGVFKNTTATTAGTFTVAATLQDMGADGMTPGAVISSFPENTANNTSLVAQNKMLPAIRHSSETCGADLRDNTWVSSSTGPVAFVGAPGNPTVAQGQRGVFKAMVNGDGPYSYQWSKNGNPIPGATSWKYITPPAAPTDDFSSYTVTVTGPNNSATSDPGYLTVVPQSLAIASVGSLDGNTVGVKFNQPVDPVTGQDPANYRINGVVPRAATIYRSPAGREGADGVYVVLTPAAAVTGTFEVAVLGVEDLFGGGSEDSETGTVAGLTGLDVGAPSALPLATSPQAMGSKNYAFGPGEFEIAGNGADIFTAPDGFRYVYTTKTGDFDVKVRVPYMAVVRAPSKAGFNVRTSLDAYAPMINANVNPSWPARGLYEGTFRQFYNVVLQRRRLLVGRRRYCR
jgi:hypothetical protein